MQNIMTIGHAAAADITTSGVTARIAIPVCSSGEVPRFIRVSATVAARFRLGTVAITAGAADVLVQPSDALIMTVPLGVTHIAAIQDTAAGKVNVAPLENV